MEATATFAEMVEEYACRDWRGLVAAGEVCPEDDVPSLRALYWLHDFAGQCDAAGVPPPSQIDSVVSSAVSAEWGSQFEDNWLAVIVRQQPDVAKPYLYCEPHYNKYGSADDRPGAVVTPEFVAWALKEYRPCQ